MSEDFKPSQMHIWDAQMVYGLHRPTADETIRESSVQKKSNEWWEAVQMLRAFRINVSDSVTVGEMDELIEVLFRRHKERGLATTHQLRLLQELDVKTDRDTLSREAATNLISVALANAKREQKEFFESKRVSRKGRQSRKKESLVHA